MPTSETTRQQVAAEAAEREAEDQAILDDILDADTPRTGWAIQPGKVHPDIALLVYNGDIVGVIERREAAIVFGHRGRKTTIGRIG